MLSLRNTLCLLIIGGMVAACSHKTKQQPAPDKQALSDSFTAFLSAKVNPLFVDQQVSASRVILDSLAPVVKQQDYYPITCSWLRFMGVQYLLEKKHDSALIFLRRSLVLATEKDTSMKLVIAAKTQLSDLFLDKKKLDSALNYARESYYLAKKYDTTRLSMILLKLTNAYSAIGDMASLRKYLFEGLQVSDSLPKYRIAFANNISKYYDDVKEIDSAVQFYTNFVQHDTGFSNPYFDVVKNENLGILLTKQGRLQDGLQYQLKAMQINRELDQLDAQTLYNTAVTYSKLHRFDTAASYLNQAMALAIEENDRETITAVWHRRSDNYRLQGRYREALAALDSSLTNFEQEVDSSFATKARELETQYAVKAKDDEIHNLSFANEANRKIGRQQQWMIFILGSVVILLIVLGIVLRRRRKLAVRLKQASLEQRLLRSQMEPHLISIPYRSYKVLSGIMKVIKPFDTSISLRGCCGFPWRTPGKALCP